VFADAEYISVYTRAEAIEDGVLKDVSELAREAGFKYPVAIELDLYAHLDPMNGMLPLGRISPAAWGCPDDDEGCRKSHSTQQTGSISRF